MPIGPHVQWEVRYSRYAILLSLTGPLRTQVVTIRMHWGQLTMDLQFVLAEILSCSGQLGSLFRGHILEVGVIQIAHHLQPTITAPSKFCTSTSQTLDPLNNFQMSSPVHTLDKRKTPHNMKLGSDLIRCVEGVPIVGVQGSVWQGISQRQIRVRQEDPAVRKQPP